MEKMNGIPLENVNCFAIRCIVRSPHIPNAILPLFPLRVTHSSSFSLSLFFDSFLHSVRSPARRLLELVNQFAARIESSVILNAHVLLRSSISAWIVFRCTLLRPQGLKPGLAAAPWRKDTIRGKAVTDVETIVRKIVFNICLSTIDPAEDDKAKSLIAIALPDEHFQFKDTKMASVRREIDALVMQCAKKLGAIGAHLCHVIC